MKKAKRCLSDQIRFPVFLNVNYITLLQGRINVPDTDYAGSETEGMDKLTLAAGGWKLEVQEIEL